VTEALPDSPHLSRPTNGLLQAPQAAIADASGQPKGLCSAIERQPVNSYVVTPKHKAPI